MGVFSLLCESVFLSPFRPYHALLGGTSFRELGQAILGAACGKSPANGEMP